MKPGALAVLAVMAVAVLAGIGPVLWLGLESPAAVADSHILGVIRFTLWQAFLSTALSLLIGIPLALALVRRRFPGRGLLIRLLALPLALPAIVGVLGLIGVFGANGWLGGVIGIYGLTGIVIAHVFFNFPMATRMALAALEAIPPENLRLAAQLGFSGSGHLRHVDRPALLAAMPGASLLIFLLCAASFTIVLTLGGGPQYATLEVAIYQALRFDFDPPRAATLALAQAAICAVLVILAQRFPAALDAAPALRLRSERYDGTSPASRLFDAAIITGSAALLLPPLLAIAVDGLAAVTVTGLLIEAILTSLVVGVCAALLSLILAWPLAALAACSRQGRRVASAAALTGLVLPPAVMATGWFLVLNRLGPVTGLAPALVVALNGLMALPFAYTVLAPAVAQAASANDRLCASLGVSGFARLKLIDLPVLKRPLGLALALAAIVSLGDLTAILLFGSTGFTTLPALIYRQMGSYRMESAAGTALVLAALAFALLALSERWSQRHD